MLRFLPGYRPTSPLYFRESLGGYRDISDGVAKQVRDEVRNEVQKLDVAGLIGERISQDFQRL
ncbi:hypothetical protein ACSLNR_28790, partial [Escherichia coli]